MPLVNVQINGRAYTVACDEGEEQRLRELAEFFDTRVRELLSTVGQVGDARLLLMAGLIVCDELSESLTRVEACEKELAELKERVHGNGGASEVSLAEALEKAAERIETIAARAASI